MKIITSEPASNGAYSALQEWNTPVPPEGFFLWPDSLETDTFYSYNGFVTLGVARRTVQSYSPNTEAWEQWKAEHPMPEPEPSDTEVLNTLLGVTE